MAEGCWLWALHLFQVKIKNPGSMRLQSTLFIIAILTCCGNEPESTPLPSDVDLRILFVGNSLTYTNDLPALVQELGAMQIRQGGERRDIGYWCSTEIEFLQIRQGGEGRDIGYWRCNDVEDL